MKGKTMLNLFKNKTTKETKVKAKTIFQKIDINSSFENMTNTWDKLDQYNKRSHKGFMESLEYELAIGSNMAKIEEAVKNSKNKNKAKHDLYSKCGYGKHTTNEKNQSKFLYCEERFTSQDSARKFLNLRKLAFQHSTLFIKYCKDIEATSFQFTFIKFNNEILKPMKNENNEGKQASHSRKTNKQAKTNKKENVKSKASFDSQKMLDKIVSNKAYKDLSHEELSKQCLVLLEVMFAENGMEFNKLITNDKTKDTILKALKIA